MDRPEFQHNLMRNGFISRGSSVTFRNLRRLAFMSVMHCALVSIQANSNCKARYRLVDYVNLG